MRRRIRIDTSRIGDINVSGESLVEKLRRRVNDLLRFR